MNIYAVIPAAGNGSRAGFDKNKILQKMSGVSVLARTVAAFVQNENIAGIAVCVNGADRAEIGRELHGFANVLFIDGGATRTESVKNALEALATLPCPPDYVLVHDAARPFVTQQIIEDCIRTVRAHGSAVCSLPCTDTLVCAKNGMICGSIDREHTFLLQTPQGFSFPELLNAYRKITPQDSFTDDSGVYAKYVAPPFLFAGDKCNRKLTFREDFAMNETRTGIGVDTHAFASSIAVNEDSALRAGTVATENKDSAQNGYTKNYIVLGGVKIPSDRRLIAHSDGDVLCHAVMDALLSAAGLADIGHYFPDSDPQYEGADSLALLSKVCAILADEGFSVGNVSAAIVAEKPKLAPHIAQMKQNIARALQISEKAVGISAGTNEGLGYLGRGEGITVIANVLLKTI